MLREAFGQHPHVGDIRGCGYFWGLDRGTKAAFPTEANLAARVKAEAQRRGLLCYPGSGTVDGRSGDHVLLAPPYTASRAELEEMTGMLAAALDAALAPNPGAGRP